eukprot:3998084-Pyramimonas_sp.AAC.1
MCAATLADRCRSRPPIQGGGQRGDPRPGGGEPIRVQRAQHRCAGADARSISGGLTGSRGGLE